MRQYGHCKVKIYLDNHRGTYFVEMEEFNLLANEFFYDPPLCILPDDLFYRQIKIISDNNSRLNLTLACNKHLPDGAFITL